MSNNAGRNPNTAADTKRLILVMLFGMLVIFAWQPFMNRIGTMAGWDMSPRQNVPENAAVSDASTGGTLPPVTTNLPTTLTTGAMTTMPATGAPAAPAVAGWSIVQDASVAGEGVGPDGSVSIGSIQAEDPNYAIQLTVAAKGAGLAQAALNNYQLDLRSQDRFTFQGPKASHAEETRPLAIRRVTIDGTDVNLTGAVWTPTAITRDASNGHESVTYSLTLARDGQPAITLSRTFKVQTRNAGRWEANGKVFEPLGLEPEVNTTVRNHGTTPVTVAIHFNAPAVPPSESERLIDAQYITGFATGGVVKPDSPYTVDGISDPIDLLKDAKDRQPYWFGTGTNYFMALFRFDPVGGTQTPIDRFGAINARSLTPDKYATERVNEIVIVTKPITVAADSENTIAGHVYLGPKKREILTNAYYSAPWIQYDRGLVITNWLCGICTWQWLIDFLFVILKGFHAVTKDWGLAIIGLTFLVRLILHPITKRAQMNMLKFGKLAPEMERIKKKHADNQEEMNRQMMAFYREHGGTQLMGCLPMFLQMPVWIALWQAMNTTFELRHQPFLYGWTWIDDLSKPDHLIDSAANGWPVFSLPLLSFVVISGFNILPFIYGFLQWLQFKIQPKPPSMSPEQEQQQKMMQRMMLIMMPIILYASPSGLMIYMITSFLLGVIETKVVKRQFEALTANEARFEVIDDDAPRPANVQKATVRRKDEGGPKKKGLMAMLSEARERALEMQREMEKQRKKRS